MAKSKGPTFVTRYREAIDVAEGDLIADQAVTSRKVYRKRTEGFRRVRFGLANGAVREFRERFRVPVTVEE